MPAGNQLLQAMLAKLPTVFALSFSIPSLCPHQTGQRLACIVPAFELRAIPDQLSCLVQGPGEGGTAPAGGAEGGHPAQGSAAPSPQPGPPGAGAGCAAGR